MKCNSASTISSLISFLGIVGALIVIIRIDALERWLIAWLNKLLTRWIGHKDE